MPSNKKPRPQIIQMNASAKPGLVSIEIPTRITRMCKASFRPHKLMYFLSTMVVIELPIPVTRKYTPVNMYINLNAVAKFPIKDRPTSIAKIPSTSHSHHPLLFPIFSAIYPPFKCFI